MRERACGADRPPERLTDAAGATRPKSPLGARGQGSQRGGDGLRVTTPGPGGEGQPPLPSRNTYPTPVRRRYGDAMATHPSEPPYTGRSANGQFAKGNPSGNSPGRKPGITPKIQAALVKHIRAGNYVETAAALAGVPVRSVRRWLQRGAQEVRRLEEGEEPRDTEAVYAGLWRKVEEAQALSEAEDVAKIRKAGETDFRAAAWRLQHRFPSRWMRPTRLEHDVTPAAAEAGAVAAAGAAAVSASTLLDRLRGQPDARRALDALSRSLEGNTGLDGGEDEPGPMEAGPPPGDS